MKKMKKEKVSKEGSEHEPARFTQVKRPSCVHSFKLWPYTSAKKHFSAWLHPTLPSHMLAKPRHNPLPLLPLLSAALAAQAHTLEECSSSSPGLCYPTPFDTHSYTRMEMYFASPIIVPMEHATKAQGLCTLAVCVT